MSFPLSDTPYTSMCVGLACLVDEDPHKQGDITNGFFGVLPSFYQKVSNPLEFIQDTRLLSLCAQMEDVLEEASRNKLTEDLFSFGLDLFAVDRFLWYEAGKYIDAIHSPGVVVGGREKMMGYDPKTTFFNVMHSPGIANAQWKEALDAAEIPVGKGPVAIQEANELWHSKQTFIEADNLSQFLFPTCKFVADQLQQRIPHVSGIETLCKTMCVAGFSAHDSSEVLQSRKALYTPRKALFDPRAADFSLLVHKDHPIAESEYTNLFIRAAVGFANYRANQLRAENGILGLSSPMAITPSNALQVAVARSFFDLCFSIDEQQNIVDDKNAQLVRLLYAAQDTLRAAISVNKRTGKKRYSNRMYDFADAVDYGVEVLHLPYNLAVAATRDVWYQNKLALGAREAAYAISCSIVRAAANVKGTNWVLENTFDTTKSTTITQLYFDAGLQLV